MSTVREHLGLLWLLKRRLATTNPQYDQHWAFHASLFVGVHLDELITIAGGADVEDCMHQHFPEIPSEFPHNKPVAAPPNREAEVTDAEIDERARRSFMSMEDGIPQPDSWGEIRRFARGLLARSHDQREGWISAAWQPITKPGQVKIGDKLRFTIGNEMYGETAKLILHPGTDREEIIYNKRRNFYLITSMAIANKGSQKNVEFLPAAPKTSRGEKE